MDLETLLAEIISTHVADHRAVLGAADQRERLSRACGTPGQHRTARFLSDEALLLHIKAVHRQQPGPRKRLGFRTPQQVFDASFNRGAPRS